METKAPLPTLGMRYRMAFIYGGGTVTRAPPGC